MDQRFDPADYERVSRPRGARRTINYFDLDKKGFGDVEEQVQEAKSTSKTAGTKRKQSTRDDGPSSKRTKTKADSKRKPPVKGGAASKNKAPAKAAVSKAKGAPATKARQAPTQGAKASKVKADPKKPKSAPAKASKPDGTKQKSKAAPGAGRGKKTANATIEQVNSDDTQPVDDVPESSPLQAEQSSDSVPPGQNSREYSPTANAGKPGQTCGPSTPSKKSTLDFEASTILRSTPRRQFFSATSFGSHFAGKMDDPMSDTSSELSDVPGDLDMTSPLEFENASGDILRSTAEDPVEQPPAADATAQDPVEQPAANNPTSTTAVVADMSVPPQNAQPPTLPPPPTPPQKQIRSRRNTKQIQRLGNFVQTGFAVTEDDAGPRSDVVMEEKADDDHQTSSTEEEVDEPSPEPLKKGKKRLGRPPNAAAERQTKSRKPRTLAPKTHAPKTTTRKRKQPDSADGESGAAKKRRSSLVVKFKTPRGFDEVEGLLTPPDSQEDIDSRPASELDLSTADPELVKRHELSEKMTFRAPIDSKPLTRGQPEVWADSRQALCETTPYYKMPQSGCHSNGGHVYSFLLDSRGHCREYMDPDVIISRAGGSMESEKPGQLLQNSDHLMKDSQVRSVLNNVTLQNPLVLIGGNHNEGAVCKLPYRYNILGWYKPIAVWGEKTLGKRGKVYTTIKYRFERMNQDKTAWHAPEESIVSEEDRQIAGPLFRQECGHCHKEYAQAYLLGWMCLNPDCGQFWQHNGRDAPYGFLHYNPAFLLDRTPWPVEEEPYTIKPSVPDVGNVVGDNLTHVNTRGICCPQCGRCSSRRLFKGWKCDNPDCDFENFPKHIPVKVPMLHTPMDNIGEGPALARNNHIGGVSVEVSYLHGFKAYKYTVPGVNGSFTHLISNAKINREPGGADEMFQAIQDQEDPKMDLHLERRRFGGEKMGGNKAEQKKAVGRPSKRKSTSEQNVDETLDQSILFDQSAVEDTTMMEPSQLEDSLLPTAETEAGQTTITPTKQQPAVDRESADQSTEPIQDGDFMTAFSMNYGMPYKFVASGASLPFTSAPWPVRAVRADLNWASQNFLSSEDHVEFNEELIFAYLQGQKIEYHDDGEEGLGPRIATMSLGGKAKMMLRMKQKHFTGCSKTGILTPDRPLPGGYKHSEFYEKRLAAWNEIEALKDTNRSLYDKRRKALPQELGLYSNKSKLAPDAVTVTLNHGDIVLMEGYEIQQFLEHKVVPEGCLRFALTCRVVLPEHLKEGERPDYEVEADEEGMSALRRMAEREGGVKKG
ncbi:hypothetical protein M409DRAFT_30116 [Zasmidium cellare ATCC 36951]|uniref:Alpha-ketoglutarate-dependent dioxygenase AlkB-like domain-containing protein n=1 Tax=Zasmidium cellare ATCC 36951 TaxID=1080233 RepID=A0A6A6C0Y1_ZASCE|nr:uncharacterized protein M409DRAFT_30116 [Zasmidium cellare ATCC 36951]KAF2159366.1 hypothetical protein M409DRAFT_30116 [Zasmidium cellare ATCC 36951]